MPLNEKKRQLIQKSRIVSFATWHDRYPTAVIELFQVADDERRYLTDEDLTQIETLAPQAAASLLVARSLRDQVSAIVDDARGSVLKTFPDITQPGGGLYPAERADACWRDFWHFLRCVTYGIAGQRSDYTSAEGLSYLQLLYQELQVPLDAMVVGLVGLKQASLRRLDSDTSDLESCFDHLITQLKQFSPMR
ncbi:MAG: phycobilisome protein [Cyanobacteria bacterium]|nr:phycobilisome protein [Cyanobacteriota bacterium]